MYSQIFAAIAPVFVCAAIGYGWSRLKIPYEKEFLSRLVVSVGVPALVIGTISKVDMPLPALFDTLMAAALVMLITLFSSLLLCKLFRLPAATYLVPLTFPNTMNMGLPISLFAFGEEGLVYALGIYLVVSLTHFSLGVAIFSGKLSIRETAKSPVILSGLIAAALLIVDAQLPLWLQNSLNVLGSFVIPVMLITLGVSLSQLRLEDTARSIALGALRIGLGFSVGVAVAELLSLDGVLRGVVIIQSTMPSAVFNYILALKYQRSPETVAGLVVTSTLFSFVCLPLLLWFLK